MVLITPLLAFASVALAVPNRQPEKAYHHNVSFDELPQALATAALSELGPYQGLNYQGLDLITLGVGGSVVTGIEPKSPPNVVSYNVIDTAIQGTPALKITSPTKHFSLKSLYFGCVLTTEAAAASTPATCTLTATAFRGRNHVGSKSLSFEPGTTSLTADMIIFHLPSRMFSNVTSVQFSTDATGTEGLPLVATLLDSLKYTTYRH